MQETFFKKIDFLKKIIYTQNIHKYTNKHINMAKETQITKKLETILDKKLEDMKR